MVILHIVAPGDFGGLEHVVQVLGRGLAGLGHEVHVLAVVPPAQAAAARPFLAPLESAGVHTHALVLPGRAYLRERAAIAARCRELTPDILHTHGYRPDVIDAGVARGLGIPVVTTVHGFTGGGWRNRCYEWLQCRAFRRFDAVVAVSRSIVERLVGAGVPRRRIHLVQNAWRGASQPLERETARRVLGIADDEYAVAWIGRLSWEKGPDVLLAALPHLTDLPLTVSMVGQGSMRAALEKQAARLRVGGGGRLRWHGAIPEAGRLLPAFDLCVLSSRTEGTPMVLFEAMAADVPVVATCVGGVPDVVSPAEAALVPPDDPAALAAEIRAAHRHPAIALGRARAARARVDRDFTVAPWLDRYEAVYRRVQDGTAGAVPA